MSRYYEVLGLAKAHAKAVSESPEKWMGYLDTAARLYRYPFMDSLLIHAQRPNATACAELSMWNDRMYRWVNRGAKGIALIDRRGGRQGVRYVFDVADTHPVKGAKDPVHWKINREHEDRLLDYLKSEYNLEDSETGGLPEALIAIASEKAEAVIGELYAQIGERYPSVIPEGKEDEEGNVLYDLMESSMGYMLLSRCGLDPMKYMDADGFRHVSEYGSPFVIAFIGAAVQRAAEEVLQGIGITVFQIQREDQKKTVEYQFAGQEKETAYERSAKNQGKENAGGNAFPAETEDIEHGHGDRLSEERGLSVSGREERAGSGEESAEAGADIGGETGRDIAREVRTDAREVSEGEPKRAVSGTSDQRGAGRASGGYRADGAGEAGEPDTGIPPIESGTGADRYTGVDGPQEQPDFDGGGDRAKRDDLQIETESGTGEESIDHNTTEMKAHNAETVDTAAALALPMYPAVETQRRQIEERVTMLYAGTNLIPPEVIDAILRTAGNRENSVFRIIYDFMIEQPEETHSEYVKREYGTGGKGLLIDGRSYSVWFDENGMEIAAGRSVHDNLLSKGYLSWDEVSGRIHQLLLQGEYAGQDVLDMAREQALRECAATLVNIMDSVRDKETAARFFADMELAEGSYDERIEKGMNRLAEGSFLSKVVSELETLYAAAEEDPDIFRYGWFRSGNRIADFSRIAMEAVPYQAREGFSTALLQEFVTQDEMDAFYIKGALRYSERRMGIYTFFGQNTTTGDRAKYIRDSYGIAGGASVALAGYDHFGYNYDGKGLEFYKNAPGLPEYREKIRWNEVAKRIASLIDEGRYLTAEEHARLPEYEREQMAKQVVKFYAYLPKEIERPFTESNDITNEEMMDGIAGTLADPIEAEGLLVKMSADLKDVILDTDDRWAQERLDILTALRGYLDGIYNIYTGKTRDSEEFQLSLFDYMDAGEAEEFRMDSGNEQEELSHDTDGQAIGGHNGHRDNMADPGLSAAEPVFGEAERINYHITDDDLGAGGPKQKYHANMEAIMCLKQIEMEHRLATSGEQEILSKYVGWGGIPQAFDGKNAQWSAEYEALKSVLTQEEYRAARASTLNAFYTSPTVIHAMFEALSNMGLSEGNVLEPSCGVGNFMGLLPERMQSVSMYGVELDSLTGRIARQLYQKNRIAIKGFEKTQLPDNFFDAVIGNVPFGEYQVADPNYDRHHFLIHDYFIARSIDLVRPGGVIAVVTSAGTMDKKDERARRYFAQRADLLGAIRLPNNAFLRNANTGVVADILFFQKRDRAMLEEPDWVHTREIKGGSINAYFAEHSDMVLGELTMESTQYGNQELTVKPHADRELADLLSEAVKKIHGTIPDIELPDLEEGEADVSIPADPNVLNYSYAVADDKVYYRENSRMYEQKLPTKTAERIKGMVGIRDITRGLLQAQLEDGSDIEIKKIQTELNDAYDAFTKKNGLINSNANKRAFAQDSGYSLISALEVIDDNGELVCKADIFTKRTIRKAEAATSVDTASEALAVSIGEKACVDLAYMSRLTGRDETELAEELRGVIFQNPVTMKYETADEYLSGNVRSKLRTARTFAQNNPVYAVNVEALERVQPKDLDASEIEVRLG